MDGKCLVLNQVLNYRSENAIGVFKRKFKVSSREAEELWIDLMKWLWLGWRHKEEVKDLKPRVLAITTQIIAIDEMWHSFLLCTSEYIDFCNQYFGSILHHLPGIEHKEKVQKVDVDEMIRYVTFKLGQETSFRWFVTLPIIFEGTDENLVFDVKNPMRNI